MAPPPNTAVVLIDRKLPKALFHSSFRILLLTPLLAYNDFLHPDGKLNPLVATSLAAKNTITHLKTLIATARANNLPIYYGLHQQARPGFLAGWNHATPLQKSQKENVAFEEGSWGVEIFEGLGPEVDKGDVVVSKHWSSR